MDPLLRLCSLLLLVWFSWFSSGVSLIAEEGREIPAPLKAWEGWALWEQAELRKSPVPFNDAGQRLAIWPSTLRLEVNEGEGRFAFAVSVYAKGLVPLPGSGEAWPVEVWSGEMQGTQETQLAVVPKKGRPVVELEPGEYRISGRFRWAEMPQRLTIPAEVGVLELVLNGENVEFPAWERNGTLWLRQERGVPEEKDREFTGVKLYSVLEDGIPLRLIRMVELAVSGKSREEQIGAVLPEGWHLASLESAIPAAVDGAGNLKVQLRSGTEQVRLTAFRFDNPVEIGYAAGATPPVKEELMAFRAAPDLRTLELEGVTQVDVARTTFPKEWHGMPVYRWENSAPFRLQERMRGVGRETGQGLKVARMLWFNEGGGKQRGLTFQDKISGTRQTLWRLDMAPGQVLEAAQAQGKGGKGLLITRNPETEVAGVEIRERDFAIQATGRIADAKRFPAAGWEGDVQELTMTLNLPPGWRLIAALGSDRVSGDWLTAWSLFDLFLLLVFTVAVFRIWGWKVALVGFAALGLSYHEVGAPVVPWLLLLVPLALLRVLKEGRSRMVAQGAKWVLLAVLLLALVPFLMGQVQQAIYPQLELPGQFAERSSAPMVSQAPPPPEALDEASREAVGAMTQQWGKKKGGTPQPRSTISSLGYGYESEARIQAGRGVPQWTWRTATMRWNGPVSPSEEVQLVLLPRGWGQALSLIRVALLVGLLALLLEVRRWSSGRAAAVGLLVLTLPGGLQAQEGGAFPNEAMLQTLKERLSTVPAVFPHAADIPSAVLKLEERELTMTLEIHAAVECAVPVPGPFPAWSPISVSVNDAPAVALMRKDGYLWVLLGEGVNRVEVRGVVGPQPEWALSFLLAPRTLSVEAPAWEVTGVDAATGKPGGEVFFVRKERGEGEGGVGALASGYDRQWVESWVRVEREIRLGLVWQVVTTVTRETPPGTALDLRIPLLPGERLLTGGVTAREGQVEVRMGAQEQVFRWTGELDPTATLNLVAPKESPWAEQWRLVVGPVWNVKSTGVAPVFEQGAELVPVWRPWPGEAVTLAISHPSAIEGAVVAADRVAHTTRVGVRERSSTLKLTLRSSLGEDFRIGLPDGAEVTGLTLSGATQPLRRDGEALVVTLTPGEQVLEATWRTERPLETRLKGEAVRLPVESANIDTALEIPPERWVLWLDGPLRGPAVRFWGVLVMALLAGAVLGRVPGSPLKTHEWMLLTVGLTQNHIVAALIVVGWFFVMVLRGKEGWRRLPPWVHNLGQLALIAVTFVAIGVLLYTVWSGLSNRPEMFIAGNGGRGDWQYGALKWFSPLGGGDGGSGPLPQPEVVSVSVWWYRGLMLLWALWLANALVRWLGWGWRQFGSGSLFRPWRPSGVSTLPPPPPPAQSAKP